MNHSLAVKLILAFTIVSLLATTLVALTTRLISIREFDRLLLEQSQYAFVEQASSYYRNTGSWIGVEAYMQARPLKPPRHTNEQVSGGPNNNFVFGLIDTKNRVIIPAPPFLHGQNVPASLAQSGVLIKIDGKTVGMVLMTDRLPALDPIETIYLARTGLSIFIAALGATILAILLGIFLSGSLTRPLRELTTAIRGMAAGNLQQSVPVRSQVELGELANAFYKMSTDLVHANQLRRQMTADIAHDLRTPMTVIAGYIEAMKDGSLQASSERLNSIHVEVQHLQRLIEDLRTLSLADAGELPLNRRPIQVQALLEQARLAHEPTAHSKAISIQTRIENRLPDLLLDPGRIAQVLGNLLSNAIRHTPPGGGIILGARLRSETIEIEVQDNGEGISGKDLANIFERFYRGDEARVSSGESGLGLAIARSIVEAHGGLIEAESRPVAGTCFRITFQISDQK